MTKFEKPSFRSKEREQTHIELFAGMLHLFSVYCYYFIVSLLFAASTVSAIDARTASLGDHYIVLETLPHDEDAFTQGLTFDGEILYESTGLYGHSEVRHLNSTTGQVLKTKKLQNHYFGEGLTYYETMHRQGRLIQIVWRKKIGFIYEADTLKKIKTFQFKTKTTEGWGITYDPVHQEFIVSDGSSYLHYWDRNTLKEKRRVDVAEVNVRNDNSIRMVEYDRLNELEYTNGTILANVWQTDKILKIDQKTGIVLRIYDFSDLRRPEGADVFNGISVTGKDGEFWVTGKHWPNMYRVKLL